MYTRTSEYLEWIYDSIHISEPCGAGLQCLPDSRCRDIADRMSVVNVTTSPVVKAALEQELVSLRCHDILPEEIFATHVSDKYCCQGAAVQACSGNLKCLPESQCEEVGHRKRVAQLTTSPAVKTAIDQELVDLSCQEESDTFHGQGYCCHNYTDVPQNSPNGHQYCTIAGRRHIIIEISE